jgi:hypothetical protein
MQTHVQAPGTATRTPGLSRWPNVAGIGLALALAAAIGVAKLTGNESARTAGTTAAAEAEHVRPARSAGLTEAPPILYIAATQEQAAFVLERSAEVNALRTALGQPEVSVAAVVVVAGAVPALDGMPVEPGLRVIDLRPPTAMVTPADSLARELDALIAAGPGVLPAP